jgi:calcium-dependent protein kinase
LDENKDGKLQYSELLKGFEEYYGDAAKDEVDRIFEMVDGDHSGEIDFSEFVTATVNRNNLLQEDKLKLAFQYYDTDNSGEITVEEIKDALGVGKGNIDEHVWKQVA